ncbi:SCP-like protein [Oesophagostomum dentatum]|uniref:SCP-like protein n=1 Tax=Oesophagostomum dentatum TaxID=61180 RepID=A0A0B1TF13_OESDE|nr:SCP-like protein [Oesophagostomum dentatum]
MSGGHSARDNCLKCITTDSAQRPFLNLSDPQEGQCTEYERPDGRYIFDCYCSSDTYCATKLATFQDYLKEKMENTETGKFNYHQCLWNNLYAGDIVCLLTNTEMNNELRRAFLKRHNGLRSNLALGIASNGQTGTFLRKANKMPQLTYSCALETAAIQRAKQCASISSSAPSEGVSENLRSFTVDIDRDPIQAAKAAVNSWFSEIARLESSIDQIQNLWYDHMGISSFAKIASDKTTEVGCAIVKCEEDAVLNVVCHYNTTLTEASKLYSCGPTCRRCPEGVDSCDNGLCPVLSPNIAAQLLKFPNQHFMKILAYQWPVCRNLPSSRTSRIMIVTNTILLYKRVPPVMSALTKRAVVMIVVSICVFG